jgi:hypothetical protein
VRACARKGESVATFRQQRLELIEEAEQALRPLNDQMVAAMPEHVRVVAGEYGLALMACIADAIQHPDVDIIKHFVFGFPCAGVLPRAHVWNESPSTREAQATISKLAPVSSVFNEKENMAWNAYVGTSVKKRGLQARTQADAGQHDAMVAAQAVWDATAKECAEGWILGKGKPSSASDVRGFTAEELDAHPWLGKHRWRAMRRFGVFQKGKWRPVDDMTENGLNDVTFSREKLALDGATFPLALARAYGRHLPGGAVPGALPAAFEGGTDDAKKAYRRIPAETVGMMVVAVWNPSTGEVEYFIVLGMPFGAVAAVYAWNRYPALLNSAARRLLAVPCGAFYDDFFIGGAPFERGSGQLALGRLAELFGIGFADDKHVDGDQIVVFVGVENDFSRLPLDGCARIGVTDSRKESVAERLHTAARAQSLSSLDASSLAGKTSFTISPVFGRFGRAALRPLLRRAHSRERALSDELRAALHFLERTVAELEKVVVPLRCPREAPCSLFTDASYSRRKGGRIGIVLWCPRAQRLFYADAVAPAWMREWLEDLELKRTYICQFELLAALAAYLTFPDLLADRQVHHFIDNSAAISGLVSAYSSSADSCAIIHAYYVLAVTLRPAAWFSFVYSEDNIADLPSRGEFALLLSLGAIRRDCVLPSRSSLVSL